MRFVALFRRLAERRLMLMNGRRLHPTLLFGLILLLDGPRLLLAEPPPTAVAAFNAYTHAVETRLARQHRGPNAFLAATPNLRPGEIRIERVQEGPPEQISGALLHHWRGTAFAPGATPADFLRLMRDFKAYPQRFAPQVVRAGVTTENGDRMQAWMRIRQRHVITVVMDTAYDIRFGQLDARHGYSLSESTHIAEIANPGTSTEHALSATDEHGFLWRLNTYWSYEARDGGLYLQIETVSLTRAIPTGIAWAVRPYVESIPRESMEFTLHSACAALGK